MIGRSATGALLAAALLAGAPSGCAFAVEHPAATAGIVGGAFGAGTCKLASDNTRACLAVGGGAGAFLALVVLGALWLGGDGHSVLVEEQAQPLPEDSRPAPRKLPAEDPAAADPNAAPTTQPNSPPPSSAPPSSAPPSPPPPSPVAPISVPPPPPTAAPTIAPR